MNSKNQQYYSQCLELMNQFAQGALSGVVFSDLYYRLWSQKRDEDYEQVHHWKERYDLQLMEQLDKGKITKKKFSQEWDKLWGHTDPKENDLLDIINKIAVATDALTPDGIIEYPESEITEDQLREEVRAALEEIKALNLESASP